MRAISFSATIPQIQNRTKTVTRRLGWKTLKPGQELRGVEKAMGLKKGEKHKTLAIIKVTGVRQEPLNACTNKDAVAEGFPEMTGAEFAEFFCKAMRCTPDTNVTRIEFEYIDDAGAAEFESFAGARRMMEVGSE